MHSGQKDGHEQAAPSPDSSREDQFVRDPVCGMKVNPGNAKYTCEHDGQQYFFCSQRCLTKFQAEPTKYLNLPPEPHATAAHSHHLPQQPTDEKNIYTCPMHPEVRQTG